MASLRIRSWSVLSGAITLRQRWGGSLAWTSLGPTICKARHDVAFQKDRGVQGARSAPLLDPLSGRVREQWAEQTGAGRASSAGCSQADWASCLAGLAGAAERAPDGPHHQGIAAHQTLECAVHIGIRAQQPGQVSQQAQGDIDLHSWGACAYQEP